MEVIRRRGPASGSVVEKGPAPAEVGDELKENIKMSGNGLIAMFNMGDGEVRWEDRHRIAEDQIIATVMDPFLILGKMIQTKETSPFL